MADENTDQGAAEASNAATKQLLLQKVYVKDLSFESPKAPEVFRTNVVPETQLNMRYANTDLGDGHAEVTLTLTVEAKENEAILFLIELTQAGVFLLEGYSTSERSHILGSYCPNTLYPFAREAVSDIVSKGGFPQLLLQPINFDALYAQAVQEQAARSAAEPAQEDTH